MEAYRSISPKEIATKAFAQDKGGDVLVWHNPKVKGPERLRDYLLEQKCPNSLIDKLVTGDNRWRFRDLDNINPYSLPPYRLLDILTEKLNPVYDAVNASLDGMMENGFNKHDKAHILKVGHIGLNLLRQGGHDADTQRRFVVAAAFHDVGNLLSRKAQSYIAPRFIEEILPNMQVKTDDMKIIKRAIVHHEEDTAMNLMRYDNLDFSLENRTKHINKVFCPEGLALMIADKTEVGRGRLSSKPKENRAVDQDVHFAVNLFLETDKVEREGNSFKWNLLFNPEMTKEEAETLGSAYARSSTKKKQGVKPHAPTYMHTQYALNKIEYFNTIVQNFHQIYGGRVFLTIESAFALYPDIDKFELSFVDGIKNYKITADRNDRSTTYEEIGQVANAQKLRVFKADKATFIH